VRKAPATRFVGVCVVLTQQLWVLILAEEASHSSGFLLRDRGGSPQLWFLSRKEQRGGLLRIRAETRDRGGGLSKCPLTELKHKREESSHSLEPEARGRGGLSQCFFIELKQGREVRPRGKGQGSRDSGSGERAIALALT